MRSPSRKSSRAAKGGAQARVRAAGKRAVEQPEAAKTLPSARPLTPQLSLTDAFATLYDKAADDVLTALDVAASDTTPNNVHRMRVTVRRLRSGLKQFKTGRTDAAIGKRDGALADLAQAFAIVRDVDVLKTELVPQLAGRLGLVPVNRLDEALEKRRLAAARKALAYLNSEPGRALKKQLADHAAAHRAFLDRSMRSVSLADHVPDQLRRAAKRLKKRCRDFPSLDAEQLHSARKAVKTLRYTFDLYASLYPERRALELSVNLKAMQDAFGALNDLTLTPHLDAIRDGAPDDVALAHATGFLAGAMTARADHARADARAAWKMVRSTTLFRDEFRLG